MLILDMKADDDAVQVGTEPPKKKWHLRTNAQQVSQVAVKSVGV